MRSIRRRLSCLVLNPEGDKQFRLFGTAQMSTPDISRYKAKEVTFESYLSIGYNYRMTDIRAAVGREKFKRLPEMIERRRFLAKRYDELLKDVTELTLRAYVGSQ